MAAVVEIGTIQIGGASNATGVFNGQNMQNDWDSHAPNLSSLGPMMGNSCVQWSLSSGLWNEAVVGQPTMDADYKNNHSPLWNGP